MQAYSTWIPMDYRDSLWNGDFFKILNKIGFVNKSTNMKIVTPKLSPYATIPSGRGIFDIDFKWNKDFYGTTYFNMMHDWANNINLSFRVSPLKNTGYNYSLWDYGTYNATWFNFIPLYNNSFFINILNGPSYPYQQGQPLPIIINKEPEDIALGDYLMAVVGFFPSGKNYQGDFTYLFWQRYWTTRGYESDHPRENNYIFFPTKKISDFKPYCNSSNYPRTINTNLNKYVLTKMPWGNNVLDNLFLATVKPSLISPGSTFTYNNKTYLLLFNNFVMEVENAIL